MVKRKFSAHWVAFFLIAIMASSLVAAREGDDYVVESITQGWNGITDVKLKNPRTGNRKSITIVGTPDLNVGDRVKIKIMNGREVIVKNGVAVNAHQEDEFRVQTINPAANGRYSVQLQSLRAPGYVKSLTLEDVFNIKVGDIVRTKRVNGRDVIIGQQAPRPTPTPSRSPSPTRTPFTLEIHNTRPIWSGPWWPEDRSRSPHLYDSPGPLEKYDQWTGTTGTKVWEVDHHSSPPSQTSGYQGHCDGWAVSSALCEEPIRAVLARKGSSIPVRFESGDVKGLLAALWEGFRWETAGRTAGGRWLRDLQPIDFHKFLLCYIYESRLALVFNLSQHENAVWNYPCDGFKMTGTPDARTSNSWKITVQLDLADDGGVSPEDTGRKSLQRTFAYSVSGRDPKSWRDSGLRAQWTNPGLHPLWIFCPTQAAPSGVDSARHHQYADTTFGRLVEGLLIVSSGQSDSWRYEEYTIEAAGRP